MASVSIIMKNFQSSRNLSSFRRGFTAGRIIYNKPSSGISHPNSGAPKTVNVPGLSNNVVILVKDPVGPGASKESNYKNPEYFYYHRGSFHEAEVEMAKYRLPQPTNKA